MMSRTGHGNLRRALYMPGRVVRRHNPVLKVFGDRLKLAGLTPKAVIGAVMRQLTHLIYGVIKSGQPFDANVCRPGLGMSNVRPDPGLLVTPGSLTG
jgi:transposase